MTKYGWTAARQGAKEVQGRLMVLIICPGWKRERGKKKETIHILCATLYNWSENKREILVSGENRMNKTSAAAVKHRLMWPHRTARAHMHARTQSYRCLLTQTHTHTHMGKHTGVCGQNEVSTQ